MAPLLAATLIGSVSCAAHTAGREHVAAGREEIMVGHQQNSAGILIPTGRIQHGKASWYSTRTNGGTRTASGERLSNDAATAAHRHLPMGTIVKVTNLRNGLSENVRITDRGPFTEGRIIDVTIGTAEKLGMVKAGVVPVKVEPMKLVSYQGSALPAGSSAESVGDSSGTALSAPIASPDVADAASVDVPVESGSPVAAESAARSVLSLPVSVSPAS